MIHRFTMNVKALNSNPVVIFLFLLLLFTGCKKLPNPCFTASPLNVGVGELVTFNAACSKNADSYEWDFGDGGIGDVVSPTHKYFWPGTFTTHLQVTNEEGSTITTGIVTVTTTPPTVNFKTTAGYTWTDDTVVAGSTIMVGVYAVQSGSDALVNFDVSKKVNDGAYVEVLTEYCHGAAYSSDFNLTVDGNPGDSVTYFFTANPISGIYTSKKFTITLQ
jgi:PKD repeat protein